MREARPEGENMGFAVAGLWFLCALPSGYLAVCLLRTYGQPSPRLDWVELAFVSALAGTLIIGWAGLVWAEIGLFNGLTVAGTLGLILAGIGVGIKLRQGVLAPLASAPPRTGWLLLGLFILALAAFSHPAEFILGGADAGVYVNVGANIARTGSLLIHEAGLAELPSALWPGLFRQLPPGSAVEYVRFPGFYLSDDVPGLITPQFFPLHPVWLAMGNRLLGLRASLYLTPLWAALGVAALALALKRAFDARVGLVAALLLALAPIQIYFARYPTAEPLTQWLVWGGGYSLTAFVMDGSPMWGMLAGLALGQVFLARIDAAPLLALPMGWLVLAWRRRSWRAAPWFLVPLGLTLLHAAAHARLLAWPYAWETYGSLERLATRIFWQGGWLLAILLPGLLAFFWAIRRRRLRLDNRAMRQAGAAAVAALGLFAYFIWPQIGQTLTAPYWYGGATIPVQNHLNLLRLGWYLSPPGIGLGIAGMMLMLLKGEGERMWAVVMAGLIFSILYLYNIMNNPFHLYAMRRYVPVVIPFFAAGAAYALVWLWDRRGVWRPAGAAAWVLGTGLAVWLAFNDRAVWNLVEYRGLIEQVESLAGELEPSAVLLFDDQAPVGVGSTLGTPLHYLYGFTAFDLQEDKMALPALAEAVAAWQAAGRVVYWIEGPRSSGLEPPFGRAPAQERLIRLSRLEQSYEHLPVRWEQDLIPLKLYRVNGK